MKKSLAFAVTAVLLLSVLLFSSCQGEKPSGLAEGDAAAPVIVQQPSDITVRNGEGVQALSIDAYLNDGGLLSYQWYSNTSDSNESGVAIEGATKKIFMPNTSLNSVTYYYCVVTNTNNSLSGEKVATVTSDVVMVKVYSAVEPPRITAQPKSASYVLGAQEEAFSVYVNASVVKGTLSYQWYSSAIGSYEDAVIIADANSAEYTPSIADAGSIYYFCEITNTDPNASEGTTSVIRSKLACISTDYEYDKFVFEALGENTCKLIDYTGQSLNPYIPATDKDGRAVTEIGAGVFAKASINSISIPATVHTLGSANSLKTGGVFEDCTALKEVKFDGQFKFIGDASFDGCSAMQTNLWDMCKEVETINNGAFNSVGGLPENLVFPATLKGTIGHWAFENVKGVKTISFAGEGVTTINGATFASISTLESVVIPASVTKISDSFKGCYALKSVIFERSAVVDGSITSGVPFVGTDYPSLKIYVPQDSYDAYCSSMSNYKDLIIDADAAIPHTLTIVGATIDGESSFSLLKGAKLNASAAIVYTGEGNLGWVYNGRWYENYAELAEAFLMTSKDCTLSAVYAEDFDKLFVPAAKPERKEGGSVLPTAEYVKDADGNIVATRFSAEAGDNATYFKILNNSNYSGENTNYVNNVFGSSKSCILLTFKNNSDKAVTLTYEIEYFGVRGSTTVTLAAGEEKTVFVTVAAVTGRNDSDSTFHQMKVENAADGYDVTIYGYRVV